MNKATLIIIFTAVVLIAFGFYIFQIDKVKAPEEPRDNQNFGGNQIVQPTSTQLTSARNRPNMSHLVTIKTSLGDIEFKTYDADAPKAVGNFIELARRGFYNNVIFHRVIKNFMIQGGDPTGTGMGGPGYAFEDELNANADSYKEGYKKGVVAMANAGPNTNGSQFFIMLKDTPLPHNYTIFGKVIKGQEVVDRIGDLPTGQSDRPITPPKIESVAVQEAVR